MAFLEGKEICDAYRAATDEADKWREDYPEFERLMNNGLLDDMESDLPEVNDGSLAASLFKLAKRVIRKRMGGRVKTLDSDDAWLGELAQLQWENNILPNARSKASPRRKWKDAVRKAAGYGGQPIITLFVQRGNYTGADFIVPYAPDVKLEAGKDSDEDSDIIFWDCYFTKLQLENMLEEAKEEMKEAEESKTVWKQQKADAKVAVDEYDQRKGAHEAMQAEDPTISDYDEERPEFDEDEPEPYNIWDTEQLEEIINSGVVSDRPGNEENSDKMANGIKTTGFHFYISWQRGVNAPFNMHFNKKDHDKPVRAWSNPDPTGDVPCHYLYCYQDFVNPYGIGIVKLAGGTQNVLDYFRKADVLATQLGLRRPKILRGDTSQIDWDTLVMEEDATWDVGQAEVEFVDMADGVYRELPGRMSMYQTSLQKVLPMGDTTIGAGASGDPQSSKTPAGVKLAAANLSIDDEDFTENVDECQAAVARSMINTHFANMQGSDLMKLTGDQADILYKAGIDELAPDPATGEAPRELEVYWDDVRAQFDFEVETDDDKMADDATKLEGYKMATDFLSNPNTQTLIRQAAAGQPLILGSKKVDLGELVGSMLALATDNDKIVTDVTPDEMQAEEEARNAEAERVAAEAAAAAGGGGVADGTDPAAMDNSVGLPDADLNMDGEITPEEAAQNVQAVMQEYQVDEETAASMLEAERQEWPIEKIIATFVPNYASEPTMEPAI